VYVVVRFPYQGRQRTARTYVRRNRTGGIMFIELTNFYDGSKLIVNSDNIFAIIREDEDNGTDIISSSARADYISVHETPEEIMKAIKG
jgi:hypothetical protein